MVIPKKQVIWPAGSILLVAVVATSIREGLVIVANNDEAARSPPATGVRQCELPEVRSPAAGAVSLRQKAAYTAASLAVFMACSHILLFRFSTAASMAVDPLYWMQVTSVSRSDPGVMAMGVIPLIVSEGIATGLVRKNKMVLLRYLREVCKYMREIF